MAVHALPAPLRIARIGANDQLLEVGDGTDQGIRLRRQGAFTPAEEPRLVGIDANIDPVRKGADRRQGSELGNLHVNVTNLRRCRSEEHTSELQSLMRKSYAVFGLKKKKKQL